jgi:uncharacterized protein YjbJ (UPF0337 family)
MAKTDNALDTSTSTEPSTDPGATDKAKEVASAAKDKAGEAATAMLDKTEGVREEARTKAVEMVDTRKGKLVEEARSIKSSIESTADALREEQPQIADLVERAATSVDDVIGWVETRQVGDIVTELGTQVRQRPLLFAAAMFGVGFALTRVAKPAHIEQQKQLPAPTATPRTTKSRFVQQPTRVPDSQTLAGV